MIVRWGSKEGQTCNVLDWFPMRRTELLRVNKNGEEMSLKMRTFLLLAKCWWAEGSASIAIGATNWMDGDEERTFSVGPLVTTAFPRPHQCASRKQTAICQSAQPRWEAGEGFFVANELQLLISHRHDNFGQSNWQKSSCGKVTPCSCMRLLLN